MAKNKRDLAAPCGLYCGACTIRGAHKRGDTEFLARIKGLFEGLLSNIAEGEMPPGGLPPTKNHALDLARMKKKIQEEDCMHCKGCLSDTVAIPCRICGFRECAIEKGITTCAECSDMPCRWVINFNNDGLPHHSEVLANLKRQKEIGIDAWLAEQEERWRCAQCKSPLSWYGDQCPVCHADLNQTFGPSPF